MEPLPLFSDPKLTGLDVTIETTSKKKIVLHTMYCIFLLQGLQWEISIYRKYKIGTKLTFLIKIT
jgi:hypothetical protein